jgi:cation diffusion facilitator family transporter
VVAAAVANTFIAATKFAAWALTGASSMLAEAIHSLADTGNQVLLLVGGRAAKREANDEHPFGYGRTRYLAAFLVSIVLFSLGGLFALYEAFHKYEEIQAGHPNEMLEGGFWWVPLVVLVAAIIAESFSFRTAILESLPVKGNQSWARFIRTSRNPELPVILLEDLAALLGLVFALVGVGLTILTHDGIWDVVGTVAIGLLLVAVAIVLGIETSGFLVGEGATPEAVAAMRKALAGTDGVRQVIHLKTLHLGPEEVLLAAKIAVEPTDSAQRVAEVIDAAEDAVRRQNPMVTSLYLEPDIYTPDYQPRGRSDHAGEH